MRKNKRGWITVLEATIAVMIISGVLLIVYTKQGTDDTSIQDYIFSLQKQVLSEISYSSDLRNKTLNDDEEALNTFVGTKVPPAYGYSLKICSMADPTANCILNATEVAATREKDLFAEEIIVSAELDPDNPGESIYDPMKVRLYIWENR